jgi:hypothetical protein
MRQSGFFEMPQRGHRRGLSEALKIAGRLAHPHPLVTERDSPCTHLVLRL